MKKYSTKGQAMVEFILFTSIMSILLLGIVFFGNFGIKSFYAEISARNSAISEKGEKNNELFKKYIYESAEMVRFIYNYERKLNSRGLAFSTVNAEAFASMNDRPYPGKLKNIRYKTCFSVTRQSPGANMDYTDKAKLLIGSDLFEKDYMRDYTYPKLGTRKIIKLKF